MQSKTVSILVYTVLRIALFVVAWLAFAFLTPIKGIWAIVAGILASGAISLVVLNHQREKVGRAAEGFFGGINARIDAATRAEDVDELPQQGAQGEQPAEGQAVDEK